MTKVKHILLSICLVFIASIMVACGSKIYTMTFRVGDTLYSSVGKYQEGDLILLPNDPTKPGYTFSRWSIDIPKTMPAKDLVAYARFTPNKYIVAFNYSGATSGITLSQLDVTFDAPIGDLPTPEKTGFEFEGWFDSSNTKYISTTPYTVPESITLTARFKANDIKVSFYGDTTYTTPIVDKTVKYGDTLKDIPKVPERVGYSAKWSVTDFSNLKADIKVHPVYTPKNYTITFDYNGGVVADETKSVTFDSIIGTMPEPTKSGEYFIGWYDTNNQLFAADKKYTVDKSITLTAMYSNSRVEVKFYTDSTLSTLYATRYLASGVTEVTDVPACPVKTGHSAMWNKALTGITSNSKIYAEYTPIDYTATFLIGETAFTTHTYHYGDTIVLPDVADSDKFIFVEWDIDYTTMPDRNIRIYARVIYYNLDMSTLPEGGIVEISKGGTFTLTGETTSRIVVTATDPVTLKLNGVKYRGEETFITADTDAKVSVIAMVGSDNRITVTNKSGIVTSSDIDLSGAGKLYIEANTCGIMGASVTISDITLNIDTVGQSIRATSLTISGGKVSLIAYNDTETYEYVEDEDGEYVLVDDKYVIDGGTHTGKTHYARINPNGIWADTLSILGGTVYLNTLHDSIVADTFSLTDGQINLESSGVGVLSKEVSITGGVLNVNNAMSYGIKADSVDIAGGTTYVSSGSDGIYADVVDIAIATVSIDAEGNGITGKDVTITSGTVTITTTATYSRDDIHGLYKYVNGVYSRFLKSDLGKIGQKYIVDTTAKGIYADKTLTILSGEIIITSVEAGLYSKDMLYIFGGDITIDSQCEGIRSDLIVQIGDSKASTKSADFTINIASSYVGVKAHYIECYDGVLMAYSYSDGMLVTMSASNNNYLLVSGVASVYLSSEENGINVVGDIVVDGGDIVVYAGNTSEYNAIQYTKHFYYLQGEFLALGYKTMVPNMVADTSKYIGFSLDTLESSKCARNTYIMLYEEPVVVDEDVSQGGEGEEEEVELFSKVVFIGMRNYIKGMTIMYGADHLKDGTIYSLRYAASTYAGGNTPTHLPFVCTDGEYNVKRCSTIKGYEFVDNAHAILYGIHYDNTAQVAGTLLNKFTVISTCMTEPYTHECIAKGGVSLIPETPVDPTPDPEPEGGEGEGDDPVGGES